MEPKSTIIYGDVLTKFIQRDELALSLIDILITRASEEFNKDADRIRSNLLQFAQNGNKYLEAVELIKKYLCVSKDEKHLVKTIYFLKGAPDDFFSVKNLSIELNVSITDIPEGKDIYNEEMKKIEDEYSDIILESAKASCEYGGMIAKQTASREEKEKALARYLELKEIADRYKIYLKYREVINSPELREKLAKAILTVKSYQDSMPVLNSLISQLHDHPRHRRNRDEYVESVIENIKKQFPRGAKKIFNKLIVDAYKSGLFTGELPDYDEILFSDLEWSTEASKVVLYSILKSIKKYEKNKTLLVV